MSDLLERLRKYNPPDRTVDEQRQIAQDIHDAVNRIAKLEAALREAARELDKAQMSIDMREDIIYGMGGFCESAVTIYKQAAQKAREVAG